MRSTVTKKTDSRVNRVNGEAPNQIPGEEPEAHDSLDRTWQGAITGPDAVFADPVGYLRALGLEAELIEQEAGSLAPAA